jgi:hypothetical protein
METTKWMQPVGRNMETTKWKGRNRKLEVEKLG